MVLVDFLKIDNKALSEWAAGRILEKRGTAKEQLLRELFRGENQNLWKTSESIIKELGASEGYREYYPLLEKMFFSSHSGAFSTARNILTGIDEKEAADLLLKKIAMGTQWAGVICEALARMGDERAIPILIEHLKSEENQTNYPAISGLIRFGKQVIEPLNREYETAPLGMQKRIVIILRAVREGL